MSLYIVVGYDAPGASANPFMVYCGRSGSEKLAAMAASCAVRFDVFDNAPCYRKNNPNAVRPLAAPSPAPEADVAVAPGAVVGKPKKKKPAAGAAPDSVAT